MSAHRTTTAHRLWLALLVLLVVYGVSSAGDQSPLLGCEPEVKPVFVEPADDDLGNGGQIHGNCATLHGEKRMLPVEAVPANLAADPITLIRGPPARLAGSSLT